MIEAKNVKYKILSLWKQNYFFYKLFIKRKLSEKEFYFFKQFFYFLWIKENLNLKTIFKNMKLIQKINEKWFLYLENVQKNSVSKCPNFTKTIECNLTN